MQFRNTNRKQSGHSPRKIPRRSPGRRSPLHPYGTPNRWHTGGVVPDEDKRTIFAWYDAILRNLQPPGSNNVDQRNQTLRGRQALLRALDYQEQERPTVSEVRKRLLQRIKTVHPNQLNRNFEGQSNDVSIIYYADFLLIVYNEIRKQLDNANSLEIEISVSAMALLAFSWSYRDLKSMSNP